MLRLRVTRRQRRRSSVPNPENLSWRTLSDPANPENKNAGNGGGRDFDGESHVELCIADWTPQDLILLDPFAMWRQPKHRARRNRYRRIFDQLLASREPPQLVLFWAWGRHFPIAEGDLEDTNSPVTNGYQELRRLLHVANQWFIRVVWRWGLQFAMWIVVPGDHLQPLQADLQQRCDEVRHYLRNRHCEQRLSHSDVEVVIA